MLMTMPTMRMTKVRTTDDADDEAEEENDSSDILSKHAVEADAIEDGAWKQGLQYSKPFHTLSRLFVHLLNEDRRVVFHL